MTTPNPVFPETAPLSALVSQIAEVVRQERARVRQSVNQAMVACYWEIGRLIVAHKQRGRGRAAYGQWQLAELSARLTECFGKGFDASNLRNMRRFYLAFSIRDALRLELSWSHYNLLARLENLPRLACLFVTLQRSAANLALSRLAGEGGAKRWEREGFLVAQSAGNFFQRSSKTKAKRKTCGTSRRRADALSRPCRGTLPRLAGERKQASAWRGYLSQGVFAAAQAGEKKQGGGAFFTLAAQAGGKTRFAYPAIRNSFKRLPGIQSGLNRFSLPPKQWMEATGAIAIAQMRSLIGFAAIKRLEIPGWKS
jgi:hypothetical protein